jgi:hypothetical protein
VKWQDIPLELRTRWEALLWNSLHQDLDMLSLIYVLKGCQWMKFQWFEQRQYVVSVVSSFSRSLHSTTEDWSFSHFAVCILTFGERELRWKDLPAKTQHAIFEKLHEPIHSLCLISSVLYGWSFETLFECFDNFVLFWIVG